MKQRVIETSHGYTVVVLAPTGRLDIATAWQFRNKLQHCISNVSPHVLVNLGEVHFIDSSGLTSLVAAMRDVDRVGGSLRLCNIHSDAQVVFEVTMMDSVFDIYDSEAEALKIDVSAIAM